MTKDNKPGKGLVRARETNESEVVTVIGAGVAGLTVAHELAERGFSVVVYDVERDPFRRPTFRYSAGEASDPVQEKFRETPHVGGLAATQWCRFPNYHFFGHQGFAARMQKATQMRDFVLADREDWPNPIDSREREVKLWEGRWPLIPFKERATVLLRDEWRQSIVKIAERLLTTISKTPTAEELVLSGCAAADESGSDPVAFTMARAKAVWEVLQAALVALGCSVHEEVGAKQPTYRILYYESELARLFIYGLGVVHSEDDDRPADAQRYVELRAVDVIFPAEHGYRFFPSFYSHVFDTMQRTPLLELQALDSVRKAIRRQRHLRDPEGIGPAVPKYQPSSRTVYDNLRSVELHAFDDGRRMPLTPLSRRSKPSVRGLLDLLNVVQRQGKVPTRDLMRGQLKVLQYLTSCSARREQYARTSWWEFIGADQGGPEFQSLLEHWPQALVGLRAREADARTFGTVLIQLLLDQLSDDGNRDSTLNGPTSEAWLDPWREYLSRDLGVEFRRSSIDSLYVYEDEQGWRLRVKASLRERERGEPMESRTEAVDTSEVGTFDLGYLVLATPLETTAELGRALRENINGVVDEAAKRMLNEEFAESPFSAAIELCPINDASKINAAGAGPFRHFAGIQFFLSSDYAPLRGHVYYPGSRWCLSSISQAQFRRDRPNVEDGYLGIISVVIGAWNEPGNYSVKTAWNSDSDEIAREVWRQIMGSIAGDDRTMPPDPVFYAIDDGLRFGPSGGVVRNETPFLINSADCADKWPGRPGDYRVHFGRVVFAGTYMSTFTRLVTMESANESGRHAVNAILRDRRDASMDLATGQDCVVYDPEQREPDDLWLFKRLDDELVSRGLPHMFEILEADASIMDWFAESGGDGLSALRRMMASSGEFGAEFLKMIREKLLRR